MKIWIDLTNSPHVNFFEQMIRDLEKKHEIIITCRSLSNTIELLDLHSFKYSIIGSHYGKSSVKKALGFFVRIAQLYGFLRKKQIDVAISHSSFYSPVVAKLLGIQSIYLNDNEHAIGNYISFLFATKVMVPEFLSRDKVRRQWASDNKIIAYPGVKETVYLWDYHPGLPTSFRLDNPSGKPVVFVRPEPWTAQYYSGACCFMDNLLLGLCGRYKIVLLPRGKDQEEYYRQERFAGIVIPEVSLSLPEIMESCSLFIGAGGTMTREAAVLGIPTISIYQGELLDVDRFLIQQGCMVHNLNPDVVFVDNFIENRSRISANHALLKKGKLAYTMIIDLIVELGTPRQTL
jgi:hypothetical protein